MIKARHSKSLSWVTFDDVSSVNKYKGQDHTDLILSDATQNNKEDGNKCLLTGNQPLPLAQYYMVHTFTSFE